MAARHCFASVAPGRRRRSALQAHFTSSLISVGSTAAERRCVKAFRFKGVAAQATKAQIEKQVRARSELRPAEFAGLEALAGPSLTEPSESHDADEVIREAAEVHNFQQQPTEVLVCRPTRKRQQPEWLQPAEELLGFATGSRKRAKPSAPATTGAEPPTTPLLGPAERGVTTPLRALALGDVDFSGL